MNPQLRNQILIGAVAGILVAGVIYAFLGGKRDELTAATAQIATLQKDVDKGNQLKAVAKKLEEEVNAQKARIEELIKMMPSDADRGDIPYRVKKLADAAGIDITSFNFESPISTAQYYIEYPVKFEFRAGFHTFGQFASLLSGYDKIINLSDLTLRTAEKRSIFPVKISCKISAFVYKPDPPPSEATEAPKAAAPAAPRAKETD
ncbi:MAG: type 4a pilus biogenesis protein PilO [Acidobacteria bacterium]|nr:type 4a pilus biogenesis protein PilO [Acidobacteriota bacterium]